MQEPSRTNLSPIRWSDARPHLEAEVIAARELLSIVESVSSEVANHDDPAALHEGIAKQEQALSTARAAVDRRRQRIGELGSLRERMQTAPEAERDELEVLLTEGHSLRKRIEGEVQRTSFVARKSAAWCEGHRTFLIEEVLRRQENGFYSAPGTPGKKSPAVSASLDRSV